MDKATAYRLWSRSVVRRRGGYYTIENGRWVRATSWAVFWRTVQRANRLAASDRGGNITL